MKKDKQIILSTTSLVTSSNLNSKQSAVLAERGFLDSLEIEYQPIPVVSNRGG
jgi:hypothetical protein